MPGTSLQEALDGKCGLYSASLSVIHSSYLQIDYCAPTLHPPRHSYPVPDKAIPALCTPYDKRGYFFSLFTFLALDLNHIQLATSTMDSTKTTTLSEYLFIRLRQLGVDSMFGLPGDFNLKLLDYVEPAGLKWIGNCNELNAGYAADGYARIKGGLLSFLS